MMTLFSLSLAGCGSPAPEHAILFFGDSITRFGDDEEGGYVRLIRQQLKQESQFASYPVLSSGENGDRVPDLQERLQRDVLSLKPAIVVVYIGTNDVWHSRLPSGGTPKDLYEDGLRDIVSRIRQSSARVILCTPAVIGEKTDGSNPLDGMLDDYCGINRSVARAFDIPVVDLRHLFLTYLREHNDKNKEDGILTKDGVHLNRAGNKLVADAIFPVLRSQLAELARTIAEKP